jgi:predicted transcriptional regulator
MRGAVVAEQQANHAHAPSTVLEVPVPADIYERLEALAEVSHRDTRALALDMIVAQLTQHDERAERRRAHLARIREANAETLERLADL